jgi:Glycosyl hydrolase family 26
VKRSPAGPSAHAPRGVALLAVLGVTVAALGVPVALATPDRTEFAAKKPVAKPGKKAVKKKKAPKPPKLPANCIELGIYRDNPVGTFPALTKSLGTGVTTVSTYVTTGRALDPRFGKLAKQRGLRLMVSWMPDSGKDGAAQPKFSLARIASGKFDADLRELGKEMKATGVPIIFRPMPEPNTPWYAWSGTVNGNTPEQYAAAWKRVRTVVKKWGGKRVSILWSPYVRSVPDADTNTIAKYFPGADQVDLVGVSGYNFGTVGELTWVTPKQLFASAYTQIQALAAKPFWISETGSTAAGGDQAAWITSLPALKAEMPMLKGIVWYDVAEPTGNFRLIGPALPATKALIKGRCIA